VFINGVHDLFSSLVLDQEARNSEAEATAVVVFHDDINYVLLDVVGNEGNRSSKVFNVSDFGDVAALASLHHDEQVVRVAIHFLVSTLLLVRGKIFPGKRIASENVVTFRIHHFAGLCLPVRQVTKVAQARLNFTILGDTRRQLVGVDDFQASSRDIHCG